MTEIFDFGHHSVFIWGSYAAVTLGLGGLFILTTKGKRDTARKIEEMRARVRRTARR